MTVSGLPSKVGGLEENVKVREITLHDGERWLVPQGIQRIDTGSTHGWQVRYGGTRLHSDLAAGGRLEALRHALDDLFARMTTLDAPVTLQGGPSRGKLSGLPAGVSGPIVRQRQVGGAVVRSASLSVLLPRFRASPVSTTIYIGSEHTYTIDRFEAALARAVALREEALAAYRQEATAQRQRDARRARALVRAARTREQLHEAMLEIRRQGAGDAGDAPVAKKAAAPRSRGVSATPAPASRGRRQPTSA